VHATSPFATPRFPGVTSLSQRLDIPDETALSSEPDWATTVLQLFERHAAERPGAPCLIAPGGRVLSYGELAGRVAIRRAHLRRLGIQRHEYIGVRMANGASMVAGVLAAMGEAIALPIDARLTSIEIEVLHQRLGLTMLITDAPVLALAGWSRPSHHPPEGLDGFVLYRRDRESGEPTRRLDAHPDDLALVMRSSGSTAQPKLVASTHSNLVARTRRTQQYLELSAEDRVFCVAPLSYSQGLQMSMLAPLCAGGSIAFMPGPERGDIITELCHLRPTWISAGPTFFLHLVEQLQRAGVPTRHNLRFLQSGGAPLGQQTRQILEEAFDVPVLDAYGMTEYSQVTTNSWSRQDRRSGTVGRVDRDRVAICGADGGRLPEGQRGEILVRGPELSPGYLDGNGHMQELSTNGWFHTGDLGWIDPDGFLTLTGRSKDIINRGGEKVAPAEVEAAMLTHPDVAEAVVFGVPHRRLGEDVGAAAVLRPGSALTTSQLRRYLEARLERFKVPRRILQLDTLPHGPSGKLDRGGTAQQYAELTVAPPVEAETAIEHEIVCLWGRLLGLQHVGPNDDFVELGGDSLLATQMRRELEALLELSISDQVLLGATTPRQLANAIVDADSRSPALVIPLRPSGTRQPLVFFDGDLLGGGYYVRGIARSLHVEQPMWVVRPFSERDQVPSIEAMASHYLSLLREAGLKPPYVFAGYCNGALIALEVARQALAANEPVAQVFMVDPISLNARPDIRRTAQWLRWLLPRGRYEQSMNALWEVLFEPQQRRRNLVRWAIRTLLPFWPARRKPQREDVRAATQRRMATFFARMASFIPGRVATRVVCITPEESHRPSLFDSEPWRPLCANLVVARVPGSHITCLTSESESLKQELQRALETQ
jgi:oxalate---CoA ligase